MNVKSIHVARIVIHAVRIVNAVKIMELQYVHVHLALLEALQIAGQNVLYHRNVIAIKPASIKNVQIHAQREFAEQMPNAESIITARFAHAELGSLEIHLLCAIIYLVR